MELCYIAGPYRGATALNVEKNIFNAKCAAVKIMTETNMFPITPHLLTANFSQYKDDDDYYLNGDLEILKRCDAVYFMRNWQYSIGTIKEIEAALYNFKKIYFEENFTYPNSLTLKQIANIYSDNQILYSDNDKSNVAMVFRDLYNVINNFIKRGADHNIPFYECRNQKLEQLKYIYKCGFCCYTCSEEEYNYLDTLETSSMTSKKCPNCNSYSWVKYVNLTCNLELKQ